MPGLSFANRGSVSRRQLSSTGRVGQKAEKGWGGIKYDCCLLVMYSLPLAISERQIRLQIRIAFHSSFPSDCSIFKQGPIFGDYIFDNSNKIK